MAILFSGDFNANANEELSTITKKELILKYQWYKFNDIKYHIILDDGGFMRHGDEKIDWFNYQALVRRPFPILCVMGNHEPIYGMKNLSEKDIGIGETVYQINDNPFTAYLKRGKIYTIEGIKFLVLGGALSINKDKLIQNYSWWENEYWDEQEKRDLFKLLEKDNTFDLVISHTGPKCINDYLFKDSPSYYEKSFDEVAILNDEIREKIKFSEWWCGHFHKDIICEDDVTGQIYQYLYKRTKLLEKADNKIILYNEYGMSR